MFLIPDTRLGYWIVCLIILAIAFYVLADAAFTVGESVNFAHNLTTKLIEILGGIIS